MELSIKNLAQLHKSLKRINDNIKIAAMIVEVDGLFTTPTAKLRSSLDIILNNLSEARSDLSSIEVFLKDCEYLSSLKMTKKQQRELLTCQQLYQQIKTSSTKISERIVKTKDLLNQSGCRISDQLENFSFLQ